jgi:hypothetical protein
MDPDRTTPTSMRRANGRWLARVVVTGSASVTMLLGPAGVATAQDCPVTDLSCVDDVVGEVQQNVDDSIRDAADDVATTVDTTVDTVADTVRSTLDGLTDPVDPPPPGGDGPGGHDGGSSNHSNHSNHPGGGSTGSSHRAPGPAAVPSVQAREGGTATVIGTAINASADTSPADATDQRSATTRLREAAIGIAVSLLIVLGAVLLFMSIQARLDRRDPKLALAPVTADVVTFA